MLGYTNSLEISRLKPGQMNYQRPRRIIERALAVSAAFILALAAPAPGQVIIYLLRDDTNGSGYGESTHDKPRIPAAGDCN